MNSFEKISGGSLENFEEIEKSIGELLSDLDRYDFENFDLKIRDEWYEIEMEAQVGNNRELAKANLEGFLKKLEDLKKGV